MTTVQKNAFINEYILNQIADFPEMDTLDNHDFMSLPDFAEWSKADWETV